jgi:hypothetical protein
MALPEQRVTIWNSFFKLAWQEAKCVFEHSRRCTSSDTFTPPGGTLGDEASHVLAALVFSVFSIEARANHLIEELREAGTITADVADAARWLPPKQKWFLLPTLAGKPNRLTAISGPHQAVAQLCDLRNNLMHVQYDRLGEKLPSPETALSYFERFVEAMEDMNVVLGRHDSPLPEVLKIGRFQCAK